MRFGRKWAGMAACGRNTSERWSAAGMAVTWLWIGYASMTRFRGKTRRIPSSSTCRALWARALTLGPCLHCQLFLFWVCNCPRRLARKISRLRWQLLLVVLKLMLL